MRGFGQRLARAGVTRVRAGELRGRHRARHLIDRADDDRRGADEPAIAHAGHRLASTRKQAHACREEIDVVLLAQHHELFDGSRDFANTQGVTSCLEDFPHATAEEGTRPPERFAPVHPKRGEGAAARLTVAAVCVDERLVEVEENAF